MKTPDTSPPVDPLALLPEKLRGRLALTAPEVAEVIGLSPTAVLGLLARGQLRSITLNGGRGERKHRLIPVSALRAFLEGVTDGR